MVVTLNLSRGTGQEVGIIFTRGVESYDSEKEGACMLNGCGGRTPSLLCKSKVHLEHAGTEERTELAAVPSSGQCWSNECYLPHDLRNSQCGAGCFRLRVLLKTQELQRKPTSNAPSLATHRSGSQAMFITANPQCSEEMT